MTNCNQIAELYQRARAEITCIGYNPEKADKIAAIANKMMRKSMGKRRYRYIFGEAR